MLRNLVVGTLLGLLAGAAVGVLGPRSRGLVWWGVALLLLGAGLAVLGHWILARSGDRRKTLTALPLSAIVLTSSLCALSGEPFLLPGAASLVLGWLLARLLASPTA